MPVLVNRVKVNTSTTGTGNCALGSPVDGFYSFTEGGISDADRFRYVIENGNNFEIGTGVYLAGNPAYLLRTAEETLVNGTADRSSPSEISLVGDSTVFVTASSQTFAFQTAISLIYGM